MGKRKLENVKLGMSWSTYSASAYGVLRGAGLWNEDYWRFMGDTGAIFHFIWHKEACPSSVTVYDWNREHFEMMDRIGVASETVTIENPTALNTYGLLHQRALDSIRQSIDRGTGVVVWTPTQVLEFGIINGYDDADGVFLVDACGGEGPADPLLYANLGKSSVPFLNYQIMLGRKDTPAAESLRSSLQFGLSQWNETFHITPDYANGRKGYENLIGALESGVLNPFGLSYNLAVYHDARVNLAQYLAYANSQGVFTGKLHTAAENFAKTAALFEQMTKHVPFDPTMKSYNPSILPEMAQLARESLRLEEAAFEEIARSLTD